MYNFKARLYHPVKKIFLTPDPKHINYSPYTYTSNNPINLVDIDGKMPVKLKPGKLIGEMNISAKNRLKKGLLKRSSSISEGMHTAENSSLRGMTRSESVGDLSTSSLNRQATSSNRLRLGERVNNYNTGNYEAFENGEVFYRTIPKPHYESLLRGEGLPATRETFTSPSMGFSEDYRGVMVQFQTKPGTIKALEGVGVRDESKLVRQAYPKLPKSKGGWNETSALFKKEGTQINIGLGKGEALNIFNENTTNFQLKGFFGKWF
ncbi:hypothetical protein T190115A13A_90001 [Tenacibaculum sp. 190524A02b]|uniref:RHS repeat-associated core domain-containing protein n=1 Tax=Tenacibaculum vairaonense TaxID=3137860 RepID=A0ABP1FE56_9FLAO